MSNLTEKAKKALDVLQTSRNWSWAKEIYERNKDALDDIALFYRGTKITYREMFQKAKEYAKAMRANGITKGTEIPMCVANCPETIYLLLATSMIGAKANIFGNSFDKDYILEIINKTDSNILFATDDLYGKIKDVVKDSKVSKVSLISLTDSLPKNNDPYIELDHNFYDFTNKVEKYKQENDKIVSQKEFLESGKDYNGEFVSKDTNLDDIFTITYSSGSTNSTIPKAIVHKTRMYNTIGRFHDKDLSGLQQLKGTITLAQIPCHSNTNLSVCISDTFMQHGAIALEPIYHRDFFINSLLINKVNFAPATRCFWLDFSKKILFDEKYAGVSFPKLVIPTSVGEQVARNEEKIINKALKKSKAGTKKFPYPIAPVKLSIGGGDCEHGGIFFVLFKSLQEKKPVYYMNNKQHAGLVPFKMTEIEILDEEGKYLEPYELGRIVANSDCTMVGYKDNKEATDKFFIKDYYGKTWGDCNVYGYKDKFGHVFMKGRILDKNNYNFDNFIPPYKIDEEVLKDTKKILSSETTIVQNTDGLDYYVVNIERMPGVSFNLEKVIIGVEERIRLAFGEEASKRIIYNVFPYNKTFDVTGCGKRDCLSLAKENYENINNYVKPVKENDEYRILLTDKYFKEEKGFARVR